MHTLVTCPRVGPKAPANPKPTGVGKTVVQGAKPPGGAWGMCPFRPNPLAPFPAREGGKFGGVLPSPLRRGLRERLTPKPRRTPSLRGWANGGPGGGAPWQGGVSPHKSKRGGELPTLATPLRVGPKTPANPKPTGVGKTGVQGGQSPPGRGSGGCAPTNSKKGASCPP